MTLFQIKMYKELERLFEEITTKDYLLEFEQELLVDIIKWCYISTDVEIKQVDKKISMNIIADVKEYRKSKANFDLSTIPFKLKYDNLNKFMKSCLIFNAQSSAFYRKCLERYYYKMTLINVEIGVLSN
ncbi:hypothetical protein [uncultured Croceitalea sp.]|uniref:hypothetical protein n=1 Tax=uncultured Croceitalea sp. TaxID=1798908 RepID=UPI003306231E